MRREMRDDDISNDTNRDRIEKRGGTAHPEPGQLPKHSDDNPHHRLALIESFQPLPVIGGAISIYYRSDADLPS